MIRLRLFSRDDPSRQIESRQLDEGELTLGRGTQAGWVVADPDRALSRLHLTVAARGSMVSVKDASTNGVFVGQGRQRLERDRWTPVSPGETIQFGPYMLIAEQEQAAAVARQPEPILGGDSSPFADPADDDHRERAAARNPFGSVLKADPVALDQDPQDLDAWERRRERQAGDWDPVAPHRQPDHEKLIGTPQEWADPPSPAQHEHGLGFDAPFTSPILREPRPEAGAGIHIPSDWDMAEAEPAPRPVERAAPPGPADPDPILPPSAPAADDPVLSTAAEPLADPILPPPEAAPAGGRQAPADDDALRAPAGDAALFDSFCAGARLDPNAFAGEDRALLMERLGAVYRQSILGIADLMGERTALKNDFRMVRTTIRPEGNNPFKWVPPQRLAVELLRSEDGSGYSTGERALNEALHDVKAHLLGMLAGMRAALGATFDVLSPSEIERRMAGRNFVMPGQRSAAAWTEFSEMFDTVRREADDSAEGPINRAFREGYEAQLSGGDRRGMRGGR